MPPRRDTQIQRRRAPCYLLGAIACAIASCASNPASTPAAKPAPSAAINPATVVVSNETWSYAGKPGRAVQTANYRFYMTLTDPVLTARLPLFMETALNHYRATFAGLPSPPGKLDTFVMATRAQWELLTRQLMGENAATYLRIQHGGFASGGRGVFYDIGAANTLAIAGHEGWHQYTQRTFIDPLPVWLEEGIATTMEGYRWDSTGPALLPWSNTERFDQLRAAAAEGTLLPLMDIFESSPQELLAPASLAEQTAAHDSLKRPTSSRGGRGGAGRGIDTALTYYAQIWVLVHFLREGENGKYRLPLSHVVNDALAGQMASVLTEKLGDRAARASLARRKGPGVALAYFNDDLDQLAREYARFVELVVQPGSRGPVVEGRSPIQSTR